MSVPNDMADVADGAIKSGYRWELDRAIRTNSYLRVFFSVILLTFAAFGSRRPDAVPGVSRWGQSGVGE